MAVNSQSDIKNLRAEAFSLLKPYCVTLTKEHSRENIAKLFTALQSVEGPFLQDLQEYVIFPLRIILKHPKKCSQDLYLDLYTCMEYVLGHTTVTRWDLFQDIFHNATSMLSCPTDQSKVATLSEELKIAIIQTLRTLVKNSERSVVQHLYRILCLPLLGHSVSLLLNIAEVERARNLRILAMECLLDFSQADSKFSPCMKADIGNMYASFLPGISVTLCKIITGDVKQGYAVTAKALYVWMRIVSLVMDDKLLEVCRQKHGSKTQDQKDLDERLAGLVVTRDSNWVIATSGNLLILVKQVATVRSHCNWRVRLGLVECAEHLLLHCSNSMKDCVPTFLEILVSLIGDEMAKVACESRRALELFSQSHAVDQQHYLTEILEENLHKLTTSLPRQIQTAAEEDKISLLNLLAGYLSLLGSRVKNFLLSLPHLKRLSLALMQILELECTDIKIVEERTTVTGYGSSAMSSSASAHCSITRPRKYFRHFTNERIFQKIQWVCHLLGYYGDIHLLVDHFLDIFHESSIFKLQATLVINEIMLGSTGEHGYFSSKQLESLSTNNTKNGKHWHKHSTDELDTVIRLLVDEYLNPVNFDLPTSVNTSKVKVQSLEQQLSHLAVTSNSLQEELTAAKMNKNIVQISLYLEGFGNFAKVLKSGFERFLISLLYPMLEKLGDETAYISNSAFIALWDVCSACKYSSIDELIRNNADYLMNSISLRLRHLDRNRKCPLVLKVMIQYSSAELLPLIDDTIREILDSLDEHYAEESVLFMGVLNELTKAIVRWFPAECSCCQSTKAKQTKPLKCQCDTSCMHCQGAGTKGKFCTKSSATCDSSHGKTNPESISQLSSNALRDSNMSVTEDNCASLNPYHNVLPSEDVLKGDNVAKDLKDYFTTFLKLERQAQGDVTDQDLDSISPETVDETDGVAMETEEDPKPLPHHVRAVKEVMLRCKHIVSSRNPRLRLQVLETIGHSCTALKPFQDELLPLIHQIWPAFSLCFSDDEKLVTIKALEVLETVARCAGDFVKHRITKDVLPKLSAFLKSQAEISIHAGKAYQFTVNYKLQISILNHVSTIAALTSIQGSDLDLITTSCLPYLHVKQPHSLQQACMECCRRLISIDADLMWLKLCSIYCPRAYTPPTESFLEINALKQASSNNPYTSNVTKLMKETGLL